ncbi:hypothetical protein, partial [Streptomyces sp. NPDC055107]
MCTDVRSGLADIDIPQHLIDLETAAWAEQQAGALTLETAAAVQAAYREHAAAAGASRLALEMAVKKLVRHVNALPTGWRGKPPPTERRQKKKKKKHHPTHPRKNETKTKNPNQARKKQK